MTSPWSRIFLVAALLWIGPFVRATDSLQPIASVALDRHTLNTALADTAKINITVTRAGALDVDVIDRDGYKVRTLAKGAVVPAHTATFQWDGRDDSGAAVADEAYSLHVVWFSGSDRAEYLPAMAEAPMVQVPVTYYSRNSATIVYDLPAASRVHLQAGVSIRNRKTGQDEGPVMKTVVNREVRAAGRIADQWNGMDESGAVYVPDLPNFVMAIATTPLPENSIITTGNAKRPFLEQVAQRKGSSVLRRSGSHAHHRGLDARDDVSPPLVIEPLNARWSAPDKTWLLDDRVLRLRVSVTGPAAASFAIQPGRLYRFADGRLVGSSSIQQNAMSLEIPATSLRPDGSLVTVNWHSEYGGVAANTIRVRTAKGRAR